jgi:hypothetical protein
VGKVIYDLGRDSRVNSLQQQSNMIAQWAGYYGHFVQPKPEVLGLCVHVAGCWRIFVFVPRAMYNFSMFLTIFLSK